MKLRHITALALLALCGAAQAQDIYKIETLSGADLSGTSRYVGMGGAMNALGADLSTMSTNPAAIGMYRRSDFALTGSVTIQPNGESFANIDRARASFDQAGFVYAFNMGKSGKLKYFNFGFNYQKHRNLKSYIGLDNVYTQDGLSSTWQMADLAYYNGKPLDLRENQGGTAYTTPYTIAGYDAQAIGAYDADGNIINSTNLVNTNQQVAGYSDMDAERYNYRRAQWGGIQEYDFNLSFNVNNKFYAGLTFGVYNVDLHSRLSYSELVYAENGGSRSYGTYDMQQVENVTGAGFDVKLGLIYRPIDDSPFRIGFSFSTPTFYSLTQNAYVKMASPNQYTYYDEQNNATTYESTEGDYTVGDYDYRIRTPWKLGVSLATTVGNSLALDAEYELSRYAGAQVRYPDYSDDYDYDYWHTGTWRTSSSRDTEMDKEIDAYLKPVHTFRIGAELKLADGLYGRVGYNFVSSPFDNDARLNVYTNSPSYNYNTQVDYVNLGHTNRVTLGLGYRGKHFYTDVAYQYQAQKADVYAFYYDNGQGQNSLTARSVDLNRHNLQLTIGYKF